MGRVLLIQPVQRSKLTKCIDMRHISPPIGLAYVAACLRKAGAQVFLLDAKVEKLGLSEIAKAITDIKPDILGITAMTYQIVEAARIAKLAKSINPRVITVIGGCHATALPTETLKQFPSFDFAVFGEGEITMSELYESINSQYTPSLESIAGLAYRQNGEIIKNASRSYISDLDSLPFPAFDLFPLKKYRPYYSIKKFLSLPLCSSRGCPHKCSFCSRPLGNVMRHRSVQSIIEEVKRDVLDYGAKQILFTVESFTENESKAAEFCEEIIKRGLNEKVRFVCPSRVDVSKQLLELMRKANFTLITFGIESGNQRILDFVNKGIKLEQIRDTVAYAKKLGFITDGSFIIGLPYEDEKTIKETIRFACSLPLDSATFSIAVPFPQSELMQMAKRGEGGLVLLSEDWSLYGKQIGGALELESLNRKKLEKLHLLAYLRFYARPSRFFNIFKIASLKTALLLFIRLIKKIAFGRKNELARLSSFSEENI